MDFITLNHLIAYGITVILAFIAFLYHDWKLRDITLGYACFLVIIAALWPGVLALVGLVYGGIAIGDAWDELHDPVLLKQKGTD